MTDKFETTVCDFGFTDWPPILSARQGDRYENWELEFTRGEIQIECVNNGIEGFTARVYISVEEMKKLIAQYEELNQKFEANNGNT